MQLAQVARQALQHLRRLGGQQMLGAEFHVRAVLAVQQFPAIVRIKATATARVEQMIGARYAQQKVPGEVDPNQGDLQAMRQLQCNQAQRQRLSASALQYFIEQCDLRAQGGGIVLGESQVIQAS
ncbi:hypothetical protein D3C86_1538540 [compost metagenome]